MAKIKHRESVLKAISEFDTLGRDRFLKQYGFGPSRTYFLLHAGKEYDSKAIVAVAFGYENPSCGPLKNGDFSGIPDTHLQGFQGFQGFQTPTFTPSGDSRHPPSNPFTRGFQTPTFGDSRHPPSGIPDTHLQIHSPGGFQTPTFGGFPTPTCGIPDTHLQIHSPGIPDTHLQIHSPVARSFCANPGPPVNSNTQSAGGSDTQTCGFRPPDLSRGDRPAQRFSDLGSALKRGRSRSPICVRDHSRCEVERVVLPRRRALRIARTRRPPSPGER
jgi:hypothetical protein